jgi:hypothetical protein
MFSMRVLVTIGFTVSLSKSLVLPFSIQCDFLPPSSAC